MKDQGLRPFKAEGGRAAFIDKTLPSASVGDTSVANVSARVVFDPPRRPASGYEYVTVKWLQDSRAPVSAVVYDSQSGQTFTPSYCTLHAPFHACEIVLPRLALTHPTSIAFIAKGRPPGVVAVPSLARAHYDGYLAQRKLGVSPDTDDARDLRRLHEIDPAIPAQ